MNKTDLYRTIGAILLLIIAIALNCNLHEYDGQNKNDYKTQKIKIK